MPSNQEDWSQEISDTDMEKVNNKIKSQLVKNDNGGDPGVKLSGGITTKDPAIKAYVGTKVILAKPMTEDQYLKEYKGKSDEELKNQETQGNGYLVIYEDNYKSWSPKRVFERCYREITSQERTLVYTGGL